MLALQILVAIGQLTKIVVLLALLTLFAAPGLLLARRRTQYVGQHRRTT